MPSQNQQLLEAERALQEASRYLDLCLVLRRRKTGEVILWAGGKWDRLDHCFVGEADDGVVVDLEESQIEFATWFADWLRDYREGRPRDVSLVLAGGERRGGKSFDLQICTLAACIDVPRSIGWLVANTFREREEIDRLVLDHLPRAWYRRRLAPEYRYDFINGATARVQSAIDGDTLKQGRADFVFLNEGQKMAISALVNSLGGTIDKGGIALIAANPPRNARGEWVLELHDAIQEERVIGCKFFGFSAAGNTQIDQEARSRFKSIVSLLDPRAAEADADGEWRVIGDVAYPRFQRKVHLRRDRPGPDITREVIYKRRGFKFDYLAGVDFQATPFHAGVFVKAFGGHPEGLPIYGVVGEVLREGVEDEFLDAVEEHELWKPENTIFVGDASGAWQDGAHKTKGRVSFDVFKSRRWRIEPPQKKKTDRGEHARNPAREDRRTLVNKLLATGRLFVDANACPELALALKKCEWRHGRPQPPHSHVSDALGYCLYWIEPLPKPYQSGGPGVIPVPIERRGSDFYP